MRGWQLELETFVTLQQEDTPSRHHVAVMSRVVHRLGVECFHLRLTAYCSRRCGD